MKAGVIVFPGSNCDRDAFHALRDVLGYETEYLWHEETRDLSDYGLIIVPGGFSYGDYLRPGAIARFARIMDCLREYAERGGLVLGICNGFQNSMRGGAAARRAHAQPQPKVSLQARVYPRGERQYILHQALPAGRGAENPNCARRWTLCVRRGDLAAAPCERADYLPLL